MVAGRRAGEDSARDHEDQGHHGRSAARGRAVRGPQAAGLRRSIISEIDGIVQNGGIVKGQRKVIIVPDERLRAA